jgi:hypothetical protein
VPIENNYASVADILPAGRLHRIRSTVNRKHGERQWVLWGFTGYVLISVSALISYLTSWCLKVWERFSVILEHQVIYLFFTSWKSCFVCDISFPCSPHCKAIHLLAARNFHGLLCSSGVSVKKRTDISYGYYIDLTLHLIILWRTSVFSIAFQKAIWMHLSVVYGILKISISELLSPTGLITHINSADFFSILLVWFISLILWPPSVHFEKFEVFKRLLWQNFLKLFDIRLYTFLLTDGSESDSEYSSAELDRQKDPWVNRRQAALFKKKQHHKPRGSNAGEDHQALLHSDQLEKG